MRNPHLCFCILIKAVIIPVQMIRSDIEQDRYFRPESFYIFQLKAAQLTHIPICRMLSKKLTESFSDIPNFCCINSCRMQKMITQTCSCRLAIAPGDPDDLSVLIQESPFDLADDFRSCI